MKLLVGALLGPRIEAGQDGVEGHVVGLAFAKKGHAVVAASLDDSLADKMGEN